MTLVRTTAAFALAAALAAPARAQGGLPQAVHGARGAVAASRYALELRRISAALEAETDHDDLGELSRRGRAAIAGLRANPLSAEGASALDSLDAVYASLPKRAWAAPYAADLAAVIALTPEWVADQGGSTERLRALLEKSLALPDPSAAGSLALFPTDVPLARFKKLCPIIVFLMKHRVRRPPFTVRTTPDALVAGRHHVQIGVELVGVVTAVDAHPLDQDYCFNLGNLHLEITPEWRLSHPRLLLPKIGQKVRVAGWSYFDIFHKAEHDAGPGETRYTDWEVHPVQSVELTR